MIGLPAGVWLDRVRVRRALQMSYTLRALALASIPVAYAADALTLAHLFAAALVIGVAGVFSSVGEAAIVPQVVPKAGLVQANARLSATSTATSLGGQSVGGVLVAAVTAPLAIMVEAVTSALSVHRPHQHHRRQRTSGGVSTRAHRPAVGHEPNVDLGRHSARASRRRYARFSHEYTSRAMGAGSGVLRPAHRGLALAAPLRSRSDPGAHALLSPG